jgi:MoaA/NifB/PqqE/SkfB family radical SAM enzyme
VVPMADTLLPFFRPRPLRNARAIVSADSHVHDYVVQAKGAFDETILGILKLKDRGQRVEIRVVLHALTAPIIEDTDRWIARNLPFVDHVALMGLDRRRNREGPQTDIRCT